MPQLESTTPSPLFSWSHFYRAKKKFFFPRARNPIQTNLWKNEQFTGFKVKLWKGHGYQEVEIWLKSQFSWLLWGSSASVSQTSFMGRACGSHASTLAYSLTSREESFCPPGNSLARPRRTLGPLSLWLGAGGAGLGQGQSQGILYLEAFTQTMGQDESHAIGRRVEKVWWEGRTLAANDRMILPLTRDHIWLIQTHTEPLFCHT